MTAPNDRTWFVGVDVGGTFTDVVLADGDGDIRTGKVLTTPEDPREGVVAAVNQVLADAAVEPGAVTRVVHGTTLATNVILQRAGGPVALITTEGFADLLRLGREARVEEDRYDLLFTPAAPPVDPQLTFEVRERVSAQGEVLVPLTDDAIATVVAQIDASAPKAVAVCFLHSYARPDHERAVVDALRSARPDTYVVSSHEVWPEPRVRARDDHRGVGARRPGDGAVPGGTGVAPAPHRRRMPDRDHGVERRGHERGACSAVPDRDGGVRRRGGCHRGGDRGPIGGRQRGDLVRHGGHHGQGGIVRDGRPAVTHDFQVGGKGSFGGTRAGTGVPVKVPVVDLAEVGAGGGSIARLDAGGALRVGPRSAGAAPGPACYGRGGTEATVTDANLVLGYLDPRGLAGGVTLSSELAQRAVDRSVAEPLGVTTVEAARAIHEIVNANMAAAIRVVTVQRGIDPRDFALVGFGGRGPMHIARLAEEFGIGTVVVPWAAGVASAVGLVSSDLTVEIVQTRLVDFDAVGPSELDELVGELEARGRSDLGGPPGAKFVVTRSAGVRFRGQAHHLDVGLADGHLGDDAIRTLGERFRARYREVYGIDAAVPMQLVSARVRVIRIVDKHSPRPGEVVERDATAARVNERLVFFHELGGMAETPVFEWARLDPGEYLAGPAIIEGVDTTIVVPPGFTATVDRWRNVVLGTTGEMP